MTASSVWIAIGWTFLHVVWLGVVVGLIAAALRRLLRRARPEIRHGAALACLMALAITPFVVFAVVHRPVVVVAEVVAMEQTSSGANTFASDNDPISATSPLPSIPSPPAPPRGSWVEPILTILPGFWLVGSLLTLASLATDLIGVERLRRASVPLETGPIVERCRALLESLGIVRRVGVAVCDRIAAPMLIGVVRPLILLPSSALSGWSADHLEMALLHELAHLRRRDNLVNLLRRLVESLLFFHPVTWWLSAWIRLEREMCCDRLVVDRTGRPRAYAQWLAELAGCEPGLGRVASALNERPLTTRIRRILNMEDRSMRLALPEVLGLCAVAILGAALALPSLAESPSPKPDDNARAALARLSASAAAVPSAGDNHQRNETLLSIANAQIKLGDRAGALATLNRADPISVPNHDAKVDQDVLKRVDLLLEFATARHKAGDAEAARDVFRRFAEYLGPPEAVADGEALAQYEQTFDDKAMPVVARLDSDAKGAGEARELVLLADTEDLVILFWKLDNLSGLIEMMVDLGETAEARPLIDLYLKSFGAVQGPTRSGMLVQAATLLTRAGDAEGGRKLLDQARAAALNQPEGAARDFALSCLAPEMDSPENIDEAIAILKQLSPGARVKFTRDAVERLAKDEETTDWLDSGVIKITIGGPWLAPEDKALAREALPKFAALIRSWNDAKAQARSLAVVSHLQARADDIAGALETAESIPDVRRADYPEPSDGFYDSTKPATFALVAGVQAEAGDQNGASASFAKARALTGKVEAEDQKLVAQIVLSDKLVSSGRVTEAREILAEAFPLAVTQPEPRRSRVLCMLVETQVKMGDLAGAAGNIEAIRDEPGIQKARALKSLARALRDKGDAEGAAKAARRGIEYLAKTKKPFEPGSIPKGVSGPRIARETFLDFNQESHPVLAQLYLQSLSPDLRILAGESEELLREAKTLNPFQRDSVLGSVLHDTARREGLERAVEQAEALEATDARLAAIASMARDIEKRSLAK